MNTRRHSKRKHLTLSQLLAWTISLVLLASVSSCASWWSATFGPGGPEVTVGGPIEGGGGGPSGPGGPGGGPGGPGGPGGGPGGPP